MTAPPWGHKPMPVDDPELYWTEPPPAPSERLTYWLLRYEEGTWRPNRRLRSECGQCQARLLGIYIWEAYYVIGPLVEDDYAERLAS